MTDMSFRQIPVDSVEGQEVLCKVLSVVQYPCRVVPNIAQHDNGDFHFIMGFGFGEDPDNVEGYGAVAFPVENAKTMLSDFIRMIDEFTKKRNN